MRSNLSEKELEKLLERAVRTYEEDDDITIAMIKERFGSQLPMHKFREKLKEKGLYPKRKREYTLSNIRKKCHVPGPFYDPHLKTKNKS